MSYPVVHGALQGRGWVHATDVHEGEGWDLWWASPATARGIFGMGKSKHAVRLQPGQLVNHFPNHLNLTRKDMLFRNVTAYVRELERSGVHTRAILPQTFYLPRDYRFFASVFRSTPGSVWIAKPAGKAQGRGIFLVTRISQLRRFAEERFEADAAGSAWSLGASTTSKGGGGAGVGGMGRRASDDDDADFDDDDDGPGERERSAASAADAYIVSRYIDRPMLVGGRKFDLRLYVVVVSYRPLVAFVHRCGFARFCARPYEFDAGAAASEGEAKKADLDMHLTNVAVQMRSEGYSASHGGKWNLSQLFLHVASTSGAAAGARLRREILQVMLLSLLAVRGKVGVARNSFELYGYDIMIDADLHPWLVEVNASPSLATTTASDFAMKLQVVADAITTAVSFQQQMRGLRADKSLGKDVLGGFQKLFDERELAPTLLPGAGTSPAAFRSILSVDAASPTTAAAFLPDLLSSDPAPLLTSASSPSLPPAPSSSSSSSSSSMPPPPSAARTPPPPPRVPVWKTVTPPLPASPATYAAASSSSSSSSSSSAPPAASASSSAARAATRVAPPPTSHSTGKARSPLGSSAPKTAPRRPTSSPLSSPRSSAPPAPPPASSQSSSPVWVRVSSSSSSSVKKS